MNKFIVASKKEHYGTGGWAGQGALTSEEKRTFILCLRNSTSYQLRSWRWYKVVSCEEFLTRTKDWVSPCTHSNPWKCQGTTPVQQDLFRKGTTFRKCSAVKWAHTGRKEEQKEVGFSKSPKHRKTPKGSTASPRKDPIAFKKCISVAGTTMQSLE